MPSTLDLDARQTALYMVGIYTEAAAFAGLCAAVATRTYATSDQVEAIEVDLGIRWTTLQERSLPADVHRLLRDLLTATSEVLSSVAVRLPRVVTIETVLTPASVLCYELYDSDQDLQTIIDLNMGDEPLNPLLYHGPARSLSGARS